MDHNLDDSLNLDSSIGVEFEHTVDGVSNDVDIGLGHEGADIPMEFNHTLEEQPLLMESGNEEIIVSDFIGDQFTLQDYIVQDSQASGSTEQASENVTQNEVSMDFETQTTSSATVPIQYKLTVPIQIKPPLPATVIKNAPPRPVAIAPKPTVETISMQQLARKQFVIAPQGMRVVTAPKAVAAGKKILPTIQNTVLKQNPKNLPKIKLVASGGGNMQYAQLVTKPQVVDKSGNVVAKIVVQGQHNMQVANNVPVAQPGTINKVQSITHPKKMIAFQQKTVPISHKVILSSPMKQIINNCHKKEVILSSPMKQMIKVNPKKQQVLTIRSPSIGQGHLKNFIISGNNPIKSVVNTKPTETVVTSGAASKTQLHRINVPGKGIQYIHIDTKPEATSKRKTQFVVPAKNVIISKRSLTKGEKIVSAGPPPLVFTGNAPINKLTGKPQQKLVRIAPLGSKTAQAFIARANQSLLAPMKIENESGHSIETHSVEEPTHREEQEVDSKEALRALIADTVGESDNSSHLIRQKVEVEFEAQETEEADISLDTHDYSANPDYNMSHQDYRLQQSFGSEQDYMTKEYDNSNPEFHTGQDTPLIVIPSSYVKHHEAEGPEEMRLEYEDAESSTDPTLRPRKACNCTKSQCLKLYCDCFANGEFCNKCNCINCHNNLANEELRQKAIRGCLDRNPNAFRPKIGKAKGGLEIIRRHNKGCNCKRSGCLKNYCECFEAKIACSAICKCVGCRNVEDTVERVRRSDVVPRRLAPKDPMYRPPNSTPRQPCSFMTTEVVEAVCQCLIAAATDAESSAHDSSLGDENSGHNFDPIRNVIEEFSKCLQDIIGAAYQPDNATVFDETPA